MHRKTSWTEMLASLPYGGLATLTDLVSIIPGMHGISSSPAFKTMVSWAADRKPFVLTIATADETYTLEVTGD